MKLSPEALELSLHDIVSTPVGGERLTSLLFLNEDGSVRTTGRVQLSRPEAGRLQLRLVDDRDLPRSEELPAKKKAEAAPPPPPAPSPPPAPVADPAPPVTADPPAEVTEGTEEKSEKPSEGKKSKRS